MDTEGLYINDLEHMIPGMPHPTNPDRFSGIEPELDRWDRIEFAMGVGEYAPPSGRTRIGALHNQVMWQWVAIAILASMVFVLGLLVWHSGSQRVDVPKRPPPSGDYSAPSAPISKPPSPQVSNRLLIAQACNTQWTRVSCVSS